MTYVMSDIHGNMRRFRSVMEQIDLQPDDMLYVLGDVIDRHPDGIAILQELMSMPNVKMLLGNHEYMMLDVVDQQKDTCDDIDFADSYYALALWYQNGGETTHAAFNALSDDQQKEIITYLRSLPLNLDIEVRGLPFHLIHGGDLNYYDRHKHRYPDQTKYAVWYRRSPYEERSRDYMPIFGHTPTRYYQTGRILCIWNDSYQLGIDCGSGYPDWDSLTDKQYRGRLACLRLDDMETFYSKEKFPAYKTVSENTMMEALERAELEAYYEFFGNEQGSIDEIITEKPNEEV